MPTTQTRVVGGSFSVFTYNHQPIAFLDEVHDSGQPPITQYQAVTPLGDQFPREFALPRVRAEGKLQFVIRELWVQPVWWALTGLAGTQNIVDVYNTIANTPNPITCSTIINIPPINGGGYRGWTYNNVVLVQIDDSEAIQIGALTMPRTLQAVYAQKTLIQGAGTFTP